MQRIVLPSLAVASIEIPKEKDPDVIHIKFKLCHSDQPNLNRDLFTTEVLQNSYKTPVGKPINWEHGQLSFGYIDASELDEEDDGRKYILCRGLLWKYNYPSLVQEVVDNFSSGRVKMSMECWFDEVEYWVSDGDDKQVFSEATAKEKNIDVLWRMGEKYDGKEIYRVFKDKVIFGGAAVVANPADQDAWILAVASKDINPIKYYHDLLHGYYERQLFTTMSEEQIVEEHRRLHEKYSKLL